LTSVVAEIDPLADRIIRRCLEKDPNQRPTSALQVAAALPGGDPLVAALAAGETPSPEMVAASGGVGAVSPNVGLALLGTVVLGLAFVLVGLVLTADQLTHWIQWPFAALLIAVVVAIVVRLGLLPLVVAEIAQTVLYDTPLILDPGVWLAPASYTVLTFILALAPFGLPTSLAGHRAFAGDSSSGAPDLG
jgi:hypothetical protein